MIDEFMRRPKTLIGWPSWYELPDNIRELRMKIPLAINGITTDGSIVLVAYPYAAEQNYSIMLIYKQCISRIDWDYEEHVNSSDAPESIISLFIDGPHYHSWEDNKRFCRGGLLPERLENARPLSDKIRGFDNVFRWFLGELNVVQPPAGLIELPPRVKLL